jgi:periplasmic protein TonB
MDSPRSGFRRATAASWTLAALGAAGVAGASTLAYADTYKPPAAEDPVYVVEQPAPEMSPAPIPIAPPPADLVTTTADVPPPPPPVADAAPTPVYTPTYTQRPVVHAAAPVAQPAPSVAPKFTSTTTRRAAPVMVMPAKAAPHVTASHGS